MNSAFITGIPASGKTFLAEKVGKDLEIPVFKTDDLRKEMAKDSQLKKWVRFLWNKDEKEYYRNTNCDQQWKNLIDQSEAFWEFTKSRMKTFLADGGGIIEGVSLLPHLVIEMKIPGVVLTGESQDVLYERIKENPRWGETEELQRLEAQAFFNCEGKYYRNEAVKYGFPVFTSADEAEEMLLGFLK